MKDKKMSRRIETTETNTFEAVMNIILFFFILLRSN